MKLITRDTDYAIRALCYIAKKKQRVVTVGELVKALGIPRPFLRKILQVLNKKKILSSYKGKSGGFSLRMPAHKISLLGLIKIFQGKFTLNECFFKKLVCPEKEICQLRKKIKAIEKSVFLKIKAISLASLLR